MAEIEAELQRLPAERHPRDVDGAADLLRVVGDLTAAEAAARGVPQAWLDELVASRRALQVRIAGEERYVAIEDAGRLRDALGTALPVGVPGGLHRAGRRSARRPVGRYARTHGPFQPAEAAARLGLGVAVVTATVQRLTGTGRLVTGEFRPGGSGPGVVRRRGAALDPPPQPGQAAPGGRAGPDRHAGPVHPVLAVGRRPAARCGRRARGRGAARRAPWCRPAPWSRWCCPARVRDYSPAMLDELTSAGEVLWAGAGGLPGGDGWISLVPADLAPLLLPEPLEVPERGRRRSLDLLAGGQALFFRGLSDRGRRRPTTPRWPTWSGTSSGPARSPTTPWRRCAPGWAAAAPTAAGPPPRASASTAAAAAGPGSAGRRCPRRTGPPTVAGRWSRLPDREANATRRTTARAEALLERHGVLTRGAVMAEQVTGGFSAVYPVLRAFEENGRARRGYFVETLGAAQFGTPGIGRPAAQLRLARPRARRAPSSWRRPTRPTSTAPRCRGRSGRPAERPATPSTSARAPARARRRPGTGPAARPARWSCWSTATWCSTSSAGGKTLLSWTEDEHVLKEAATALSGAVSAGALGRMVVQKADGASVHESTPLSAALQAAGFAATPRGLRLRG